MLNKIQLAAGFFLMFGAVGSIEAARMPLSMGILIAVVGGAAAMDAVDRLNRKTES
jgi:hypothetical protein|tara:strand:- start:5 stop:172 length:168 start_codon:yes stop_codon:yes gene_type:complete